MSPSKVIHRLTCYGPIWLIRRARTDLMVAHLPIPERLRRSAHAETFARHMPQRVPRAKRGGESWPQRTIYISSRMVSAPRRFVLHGERLPDARYFFE